MNVSLYGDSIDCYTVAAILADYGNHVSLAAKYDFSALEIEYLFESEPGLKRRIDKNVGSLRLQHSTKQESINNSNLHWIFNRAQDIDIEDVITQIVSDRETQQTIIISSHSQIGYFDQVTEKIIKRYSGQNIEVPNFITIPFMSREGNAIADFEYPELLVVGSNQAQAFKQVYELLSPFIRQANKFMAVSGATAEMIRSATSAMLATRLSFMNEVASLCESVNVDIDIVRQAMASDSRIGPQYLSPGCGFGGVTLQKELENLSAKFPAGGAGTMLLDAVDKTNRQQKELLFRKFWNYYQTDIKNKTVAIWGAAFKPGISSTENSAIHPLLAAFWAQNVQTNVFDPKAGIKLKEQYPNETLLNISESANAALIEADALLIVTDWKEFYSPDFDAITNNLNRPVIFDGRNIYDTEILESKGIEYFGVGHGQRVNYKL
jgi:UDPglucose 6-dehydrogenase